MKQTLAFLIMILLSINIVACGKNSVSNDEQTTESTEVSETEVTEEQTTEIPEDQDVKSEISEEPATVESTSESQEELTTEDEEDDLNNPAADNEEALRLYEDLLHKIIAGAELIGDEGEAYDYSFAENPGFALYDINDDGVDELFITGRMDSQWHTYTIYFVKDGDISDGIPLNGYDPENDLWIYGFDFLSEAYSFNSKDGFIKVWELEYPFEDDDPINLTYEGQETRSISESELNELSSGQILEPSGITWQKLNDDTIVLGKR